MDSTEAELESFRQKWREEVSAKRKGKQPALAPAVPAKTQASSSRDKVPKSSPPDVPGHVRGGSDEIDEVQPHVYPQLGEKQHGRRLDETSAQAAAALLSRKEPKSALEHYERAVEKESQGSLGDSLNLYRKAFKLDSKVHEQYKSKHFPPGVYKPPKPADPNPSNASPTVPNPAHHSLHGLPASLHSLLDAFSTLSIQGEAPPTDLSPPPPCPIATIPEEILVEILLHLAIKDVASFARLSQVCKRFAFLVMTEERVWRRIALGHEYGFAAMHYTYACQIDGSPLGDDGAGGYILGSSPSPDHDLSSDSPFPAPRKPPSQISLTSALVPSVYPTFRTLFRTRPRLRFNGVYISTVNYTRPGASSPTAVSWNTPIHIVTYYRYLRFLRNGTCISLLTTAEPADVVPYLSVEHVHRNHGALPSAPMKDAVLGRWRLTGPTVLNGVGDVDEEGEKEGGLLIETDGATPKYMYKMVLSLLSAGRGSGARNNKLAWQGYWSYNKLTDDWAAFGLRNDRPFYWSRVKSYGMGLD
ncbi:hypothetical protein K458DRAFT_323487 [Lentithecium fluviatile CBS 122367]|uniref:F-box domain-containing protein n=1 Tax=Lentithecium fluviatile CBS 122367 TaxID=1168545 RepID=A0A6G1ID65_9PLEO|nr:hypothetical protein K458DRAFT_323487 [Lentithecium fluviatile CBS 122367]